MPIVLGREVGPIGFGLMGLTIRPDPIPYDEAVKVMKRSLELGANLWNAGEIYGPPHANSLHLLEYYFRKYPEDSEKVVLSIKGCFSFATGPDGSPEGVRKSVENCLEILQGRVFISIFEPARVDPNVPIEKTVEALVEYVKAGKIGGIGLSECSASSIRRAQAVHPISAVEVELSLFSREVLENGVSVACAELDIPLIAYSPLSRGFLTGQVKSLDDIPANDSRRNLPRFQPETFELNMRLVNQVQNISAAKSIPMTQTAIAWVCSQGRPTTPRAPQVIPIPGCTTVARVEENLKKATLEQNYLSDIDELLKHTSVHGDRYGGKVAAYMNG
ncbi:uncharacterized protein TRUGW13939_02527 [Talaromyces rugulosus]|uniref:NADP-dependent oxidoreductase domain-containing protein n=1 Tax=Talaromyces rugulosus TaxID=121627 RepID=A0A7H8QND3_TALRU|nr:uncharacterized protein TRUGW13939_02527 [Talaromyces rugulosus]QKX55434.1 hypothetical protein TRUGW13939_02527 [Talaromyces rugulosus]